VAVVVVVRTVGGRVDLEEVGKGPLQVGQMRCQEQQILAVEVAVEQTVWAQIFMAATAVQA